MFFRVELDWFMFADLTYLESDWSCEHYPNVIWHFLKMVFGKYLWTEESHEWWIRNIKFWFVQTNWYLNKHFFTTSQKISKAVRHWVQFVRHQARSRWAEANETFVWSTRGGGVEFEYRVHRRNCIVHFDQILTLTLNSVRLDIKLSVKQNRTVHSLANKISPGTGPTPPSEIRWELVSVPGCVRHRTPNRLSDQMLHSPAGPWHWHPHGDRHRVSRDLLSVQQSRAWRTRMSILLLSPRNPSQD